MLQLLKPLRQLAYLFCIPSLEVLVQRQLHEAERELLNAEHDFDRATATVSMYAERCARLRRQLRQIKTNKT